MKTSGAKVVLVRGTTYTDSAKYDVYDRGTVIAYYYYYCYKQVTKRLLKESYRTTNEYEHDAYRMRRIPYSISHIPSIALISASCRVVNFEISESGKF